ncbi:MAG: TDT family transporter [Williamsia herbipolensis]|nr:TDT family transporter [Williamsia herbipolensis]
MTAVLTHRPTVRPVVGSRRPLAALDRPADVLAHLTPNWFASVMGTGIVATAMAGLPVHVVELRVAATVFWAVASVALVTLTVAFVGHWVRHPEQARAYATHPVAGQFYGAVPMALLTVGAGTLLLGPPILGAPTAVTVDAILWAVGTLLGLATAVVLPYRMITRADGGTALPAWLMPVVPPMVSASTGALLLDHLPAGQPRLTLLAGCYALFGLSLIVGMLTLSMIWARLMHGDMPTPQATPTVWISLGMIGQSITAANLLGTHAGAVFIGRQAVVATVLHGVGIAYGLAMGGFGALVFVLAALLTVRAARRGLRFSLTWWSFTFPVGTCVTGATALGTVAGITALHTLAVCLCVVLLVAWTTVAAHTVRGTVTGRVFLPA